MNIIIVFDRLPRPLTMRLRGWTALALLLLAAGAIYAAVNTTAYQLANHWAQTGDPRIIGLLENIRARAEQHRYELWNNTVDRLGQQVTDLRTRLWRISHMGNEIAERIGLSEEIQFSPGPLPTELPIEPPDTDPDQRMSKLDASLIETLSLLESEFERFTLIGQSVAAIAMQRATVPRKVPLTAKHYRSSSFGWRKDPFSGRSAFHSGYDFAARTGTPVLAGADGIVTHRGRLGNYGKLIEVYHGSDISTLYGHLNDYNVEVGDFVARNQIIGLVGSTGRSTGPHLHYEVRHKGQPRPYSKLIELLLDERPMVAINPPADIK